MSITKEKMLRMTGKKALFTGAAFIAFIMCFPFLWMVLSALKTKEEVWRFPPTLFAERQNWSNFLTAWHSATFGRYLFNSIFTALMIAAIQLFNTALIAYALTQLRFRGRNALFAVILATNMLPAAATYVPCYILLARMNLINSYSGLIISNCVYMFGIFLIRQAFLQVHQSLIDSARVEGAGHFTTLWKILVPISGPFFFVSALMSFVSNYNNYMWPSLITTLPKLYLVSQGLRLYFIEGGAYGIQWPLIMAASTFAILPLMLVFFLCQRWFIRGISEMGVKE